MADAPLIDIRSDHWAIVSGILRRHVPHYEVWAFGSRAGWTAKQYSDLDLAIITDKPLPLAVSAALSDDFSESDLPWKVDVVDWATTGESFRRIIERDKVVVLKPIPPSDTKNKWPITRIEDIAEKIAMGPFGSNIKVETFVEAGIPIISGAHLRGVRVEDGEFNFVTEEHAERMKNANVFRGDVIFTHAGNIGQVAYIPPNSRYERYVISQRQFYLRCDLNKTDPVFVSYFFHSYEGQHKLLANASQTGVPSIARPSSYLKTIELSLPPLKEQRAIAHILGALDDKIELNRRTSETLEAIARALFKSWFMDFDGVPAQDRQESELGLIPKGWRVGTLMDYGSGGITGYHDEALVTKPTIIVGRKGTVGALYWQSAPCFPIDTVFYVEPKVSLHFCYYAMTQMELHNLNTDAAVPGLNRDNAYRQSVVIPSANLMAKWDAIVSSLRSRMDSTDKQIATLAILRDTLLPKLLNGELRVKDAACLTKATGHDTTKTMEIF